MQKSLKVLASALMNCMTVSYRQASTHMPLITRITTRACFGWVLIWIITCPCKIEQSMQEEPVVHVLHNTNPNRDLISLFSKTAGKCGYPKSFSHWHMYNRLMYLSDEELDHWHVASLNKFKWNCYKYGIFVLFLLRAIGKRSHKTLMRSLKRECQRAPRVLCQGRLPGCSKDFGHYCCMPVCQACTVLQYTWSQPHWKPI